MSYAALLHVGELVTLVHRAGERVRIAQWAYRLLVLPLADDLRDGLGDDVGFSAGEPQELPPLGQTHRQTTLAFNQYL